MVRAATGLAVLLTLMSAFALYAVSISTRRLELKVQAGERRIEQLKNDIAVLKADRAFLSRPTRIEPAARALGMRPAFEQKHIRIEQIPLRQAATAGPAAGGAGP